ncbi:hypothetical protein [Mesorhizobium sp.]|uniref:hypothetical protein n=1 Tax=Mesorhizobium sp. TaxID=1871066 RepID=UPI0025CB8AF3|nr:hypothetical protein [Mesorhizobium sp.]
MRQKLASVISCPNIAFQIAYLKNAVGEDSDGIDNDGHSEFDIDTGRLRPPRLMATDDV